MDLFHLYLSLPNCLVCVLQPCGQLENDRIELNAQRYFSVATMKGHKRISKSGNAIAKIFLYSELNNFCSLITAKSRVNIWCQQNAFKHSSSGFGCLTS